MSLPAQVSEPGSAALPGVPQGVPKDRRDAITRTYAAALTGRPPSFAHLRALCDRFGVVQFAKDGVKDLDSGYCLDDNARALLTAVAALQLDPSLGDARFVGNAAVEFVRSSQRPDGLFHNVMDKEGRFTDETGSEEATGRALWACGYALRWAPVASWREVARVLFARALPQLNALHASRSRAYAVLGLAAAMSEEAAFTTPLVPSAPVRLSADELRFGAEEGLALAARSALASLSERMDADFRHNAQPEWSWWEPVLTWGNARLPEALLRAAVVTGEARYRESGMAALEFLASITQPSIVFMPIGNEGWYHRGGTRPLYDQQPIEACAMVDAWLAAAKVSGEEQHHTRALDAFMWFMGSNSEKLVVAEPEIGGCHDGLAPGRINPNMGAESTLSYVHAHLAIASALALGDGANTHRT